MIQLNYKLSAKYLSQRKLILNYIDYDETSIFFQFAEGDLIYKINNIDLSAEWEWVPILGFVLGNLDILLSLQEKSEGIFNFTENTNSIAYKLIDENILVSPNYGPNANQTTEIKHKELIEAFYIFFHKVYKEIIEKIPQFKENKFMKEAFKKNPELRV